MNCQNKFVLCDQFQQENTRNILYDIIIDNNFIIQSYKLLLIIVTLLCNLFNTLFLSFN
jgi:hypothetical protein